MSLPLSAADVLGEHVVFELECIDRVYCNAYVRKLTYAAGQRKDDVARSIWRGLPSPRGST